MGIANHSIDRGTSNIARRAASTLRAAAFELCRRRCVASHGTIDEMNMIGSLERWHETGQVSRSLPVSTESADLSLLSHGKPEFDGIGGCRRAIYGHSKAVVEFAKIRIVHKLASIPRRSEIAERYAGH
jgi:hypothetical protein